MTIDFKAIESEARFLAQKSGTNKDEAASNAIKEALLKHTPEANDLFREVNNRINKSGRRLMFTTNSSETDYTAQTTCYFKTIEIELQCDKVNKRIKDVLLHELGEADYIGRCLPEVEDWLERGRIKSKILELFSHKHVYALLNYYKLEQENPEPNYNVTGEENWEIVLDICWKLITFPALQNEKHKFRGYKENSISIEKILEIIRTTDTLVNNNTEIKYVEIAFEKILSILSEHGLDQVYVKSRCN